MPAVIMSAESVTEILTEFFERKKSASHINENGKRISDFRHHITTTTSNCSFCLFPKNQIIDVNGNTTITTLKCTTSETVKVYSGPINSL